MLGQYASPPHDAQGRMVIPTLLKQLADTNSNTYNVLLWDTDGSDYLDLVRLLNATSETDDTNATTTPTLRIWVTLIPPSEATPINATMKCSVAVDSPLTSFDDTMFFNKSMGNHGCLDYLGWASLLGALGAEYPQLEAVNVDDFTANLPVLTAQ